MVLVSGAIAYSNRAGHLRSSGGAAFVEPVSCFWEGVRDVEGAVAAPSFLLRIIMSNENNNAAMDTGKRQDAGASNATRIIGYFQILHMCTICPC
jgi:hypothetical protein